MNMKDTSLVDAIRSGRNVEDMLKEFQDALLSAAKTVEDEQKEKEKVKDTSHKCEGKCKHKNYDDMDLDELRKECVHAAFAYFVKLDALDKDAVNDELINDFIENVKSHETEVRAKMRAVQLLATIFKMPKSKDKHRAEGRRSIVRFHTDDEVDNLIDDFLRGI